MTEWGHPYCLGEQDAQCLDVWSIASGPLMGVELLRVRYTFSGGRGCQGVFFVPFTWNGTAPGDVAAIHDEREAMLNALQGRDDHPYGCDAADLNLLDVEGVFLVERFENSQRLISGVRNGAPMLMFWAVDQIHHELDWVSPVLATLDAEP